jgi:YHS domain-containing protein
MMKRAMISLLILVVALSFASAVMACPADGADKSACPYHTPNSYTKQLSVGEKFKCAQCGMEGTVTKDTPSVEHEGKYYYFMTAQCKETFQKRVEEFYKGKQ